MILRASAAILALCVVCIRPDSGADIASLTRDAGAEAAAGLQLCLKHPALCREAAAEALKAGLAQPEAVPASPSHPARAALSSPGLIPSPYPLPPRRVAHGQKNQP